MSDSSKYDRVKYAIQLYKEQVSEVLKILTEIFIVDAIFTAVIPIIFAIMANFIAGLAAAVATLGLGAVNAGEKLARGHTILLHYLSIRGKLKLSVTELEIMLNSCSPADAKCIDEVKKKLHEYLASLYKAIERR